MKSKPSKINGTVYLVGAGPGDPGLLTLRGKECLERAEAVFFDHLVNPELLKHCPQARLHDVGKRSYVGHFPQNRIERLLIQAARKYSVVVRLKGGDPFIFGRGGEEAEALRGAGIPFEVVPGVTSAVAVPAYAGIPLTHRNFGPSVTFLTGHEDPAKDRRSKEGSRLDWASLARQPTLVFLMGVKTLEDNFGRLIQEGKDPKTPAAIVEWGTYPKQRSLVGTVRDLPGMAKRAGFQAPAIAVVGEIVKLRETLRWFEKRPLFGKKIVVTRSSDQASELSRRLRDLGAIPIEIPALSIVAPKSWARIDRAIAELDRYNWILFTSVHAVDHFLGRMAAKGKGPKSSPQLKVAVVGPVTAARLESAGWMVERKPAAFTSDALGKAFSSRELRGRRILFPRAENGRKEILEILSRKGALVEAVTVYRTKNPPISKTVLREAFEGTMPDLLTFASGATARNFTENLRKAGRFDGIKKIPSFVIGPITRAAAREAGLKVVGMPKQHTVEALVLEILKYYSK